MSIQNFHYVTSIENIAYSNPKTTVPISSSGQMLYYDNEPKHYTIISHSHTPPQAPIILFIPEGGSGIKFGVM